MWVILIVAETISARSGIGYMTMNAREFMQTDVMVVQQIAGFEVDKARREFSIPQDYEPVATAAIGFPGDSADLPEKSRERNASPRMRRPLTSFVFEGGWGRAADWTRRVPD
jgi:hypothetical protein